jgi:hypothetical protein
MSCGRNVGGWDLMRKNFPLGIEEEGAGEGEVRCGEKEEARRGKRRPHPGDTPLQAHLW